MDEHETQLAREARARIAEIAPRTAIERRRRGDDVVYVDVREMHEWNLLRIPGAVHIPLASIDAGVEALVPRDRDVIVYCSGGSRSALAADAMQGMGYTRVTSLADGIRGWFAAGGDVEE